MYKIEAHVIICKIRTLVRISPVIHYTNYPSMDKSSMDANQPNLDSANKTEPTADDKRMFWQLKS